MRKSHKREEAVKPVEATAKKNAGEKVVIPLGRELDIISEEELNVELEALINASCDVRVVDMSKVTMLDSLALGALVRKTREAKEANKPFEFRLPEDKGVYDILEKAHLLGSVLIAESVQEDSEETI